MLRQVAASKATAFYGAGSAQEAQAKAVIQEAAIRARLQAELNKIQTKFAAGTFGQRAADNRLGKAFSAAQTDLNKLNNELAKHRQELESAGKSQGTFAGRVIESIGIYRVFNAAINTTLAGLQSIPRVGIQLEQTTATLTAVFGSFGQAAQQMQFLNAEAERTGLRLEDLRKSYATFSASALLAGQSAATVQRIFADVNTTATTLHLTTDQVNGVFLALSQMFNKGKVQAEELTKQLSQTLPGITNQAAKALGLSAAELGEQMKKGLITADKSVQLMMAKMADAFGGEAFKRASSNLNAELGRLSTSWTHLAENVYKASEGVMTSTVRSTTAMVNSLAGVTDNAYQTERALTQLAAGGLFVAAGALGTLAGKALLANKTIIALRAGTLSFGAVAMRFAPTALLVGLSAIAAKAWDAKMALDDALEAAIDLEKAKKAAAAGGEAKIAYDISKDPEVQKLEGRIASLVKVKAKIASLKGAVIGQDNAASFAGLPTQEAADKAMVTLKNALAERTATLREDAAKQKEADYKPYDPGDLTDLKLEAEAARLESKGKSKEAAIARARVAAQADVKRAKEEQLKAFEAFSSGTLSGEDWIKANKQMQEAEEILQSLEAKIQSAGNTTKTSGVGKQLSGAMAEAATGIQNAQNNIGESLDTLENKFSQNLTSIGQYYAEKRRLASEDISLQQQEIKEQIALAAKAGDSARVRQLELKSAELAGKASRENQKSLREEQQAYVDLGDSIKDLNAEYLAIQGKGEGSAVVAFDRKHREFKAKLDAEIQNPKSPESGALAAASKAQMEASRSYTVATDSAAKSQAQFIIVRENLAAKEMRIQNGLKLGSLSEIEALYQTQQARQEAVKALQEYVTAQERALAGQPEDSPEVRRVRALRLEVENLVADSNVFAAKFENIFSTNFANAFGQFRQGSLSAKDAFASFANGVINNIAEMAEQAMAKQVFGYLAQVIGGLSFGGSGTSVAAGNSPGFSAWAAGSALANGGVTTGLSAVSGTVLSKPTYFPGADVVPFANGGVLAGEAGKEAVIPMKTGSIPVKFIGGSAGGGGIVIQNLSVSIVQKEDATAQEQANSIGKAIREQLNVLIDDKLANSVRSGRLLNPTQLTATF